MQTTIRIAKMTEEEISIRRRLQELKWALYHTEPKQARAQLRMIIAEYEFTLATREIHKGKHGEL